MTKLQVGITPTVDKAALRKELEATVKMYRKAVDAVNDNLRQVDINKISPDKATTNIADILSKTGVVENANVHTSAKGIVGRGNLGETTNLKKALVTSETKLSNRKILDVVLNDTKKFSQKIVALRDNADKKIISNRIKNNKNDLSIIKANNKKTEEEMKRVNKNIREHFETGFSMHILQIYAAPAIRAVNAALKKTISTFAEFDKVYTDFIVKSEEFGTVMSRTELYKMSAGEVFSATDFAQGAERFAASGIDINKNTDALRKSLELAAIANIDYNESANVLIKTMQAYHIPLSDAARITDTMVGVANASTAELKDLSSWFGYAANSAYIAGTTVEEFSTILGVLSSTGMKNVGAATRQLFTQFQKESVRDNFRGMFGLSADEDFRDMDEVIKKLRAYAQASGDLKGVSREIAVAIGGKVTAQNALNNLLGAEESLWQSVSAASLKAGTTADLYTKITDNAWHSIERIKNSLQLMMIQFGEMFAPVLKYISTGLEVFVKVLIGIPSIIKSAFGFIVLTVSATFGVLLTLALGYAGAVSIASGATTLLQRQMQAMAGATAAETHTLNTLITTIFRYNAAILGSSKVTNANTAAKGVDTAVTNVYTAAITRAKIATMGFMGAMVGFGIQASMSAKHLFAEARVVNLLTSGYIALAIAKYGAFNTGALIAGGAAGIGAYAYGESQIRNAEIAYGMERRAGVGSNTYISHTYNVEMNGVNNPEDMLSQLNTFGDYVVQG